MLTTNINLSLHIAPVEHLLDKTSFLFSFGDFRGYDFNVGQERIQLPSQEKTF